MGDRSLDSRSPSLRRLLVTTLLCWCTATAASCGEAELPPTQFVASSIRVPFHLSTCNRVKRIPADKLVVFEDRESALAAKHEPCVTCRP